MSAPMLNSIWATGYYIGMRRNEIVNLAWRQICLKRREITVDADITKDDEARVVPIPSPLLGIFLDIPRHLHTDYTFLYKSLHVKDIADHCKRPASSQTFPTVENQKTESPSTTFATPS